ncbi:phosphate propanoyltransferase [Cohnella cholangitidis]|uniref:Phosphate propanoyltransferase n=1 Tax=Cohnella cholangitidis TaxID=2598458 RepID=A0A7G5C2Z2_9BACL|nr:phosphate propanoyltransferase [Cohnella cholangitidis]QMV43576.1 phosphate propanoyltransferase [Cohnella cholangitidis]
MAHITEASLRAMLGRGRGLPDPFPVRAGDKLTPAAADFLKQRNIVLTRSDRGNLADRALIPVGVSNRHVHLAPRHVEALFGEGYELKPLRELSQRGQYAAQETVAIVGPKGNIPGVRILGPARGETQVEISRTDSYRLGVQTPVRLSGDIRGTPGITLIGSAGTVVLSEGLIVARNHLHLSPEDAKRLQVGQGDRLMLRTNGDRPVIFAGVVARIDPRFTLDFHIDTDEANSSFLSNGDSVTLIGANGKLSDSVKEELS